MVTLSDGISFEAPKPLKAAIWRLKRQSEKLARLRVANIRRDALHKLTPYLTATYSLIGIEDLNIQGMIRNRKLARSVSDLGFGEFRRQTEYKTVRIGGSLKVHDRFFPLSKGCSKYGEVKKSLSLSERTFTCDCGNVIDRDLNAAKNLDPCIPEVLRELTPAEMTAIRQSVHPVVVTSIAETAK